MGGGDGYSAGQRGSGHSAAPGRRYGLTRGEPRRAAPPPPLNFRGDCTTPGVGGGGGRREVRPAGSAWTRTHGHGSTDTRTRAHGHGAPRSPRGLAGRTAALRDCARGTPRGAWTGGGGEGAQQRGHPRRPPPRTPRRTQSGSCGARPRPGALPGAARPRSPFPKVTARRGAHLAGGQAPGCSRPRGSPTLLSTGCCVGPAGRRGGVGAQASGPGGAERSGRPAALLPPTPTPRSVPVRRCVASLLGPRVSVYIVRPLRHRTARPRRSRRPSAPRAPRRAFNGPGRARGTPPALKGPRRSRGGKTQRERDARGDR